MKEEVIMSDLFRSTSLEHSFYDHLCHIMNKMKCGTKIGHLT